MFQNLNIRWAVIIAIVIGAIYYITPTYNYYSIVNDPDLSDIDVDYLKDTVKKLVKEGFHVTKNNANAVKFSKTLIVCVGPQQLKSLLKNIKNHLTNNHLIISVVSGVSIKEIKKQLPKKVNVIRAMPNTASSICESMTCLCSDDKNHQALKKTTSIFQNLLNYFQTLSLDDLDKVKLLDR